MEQLSAPLEEIDPEMADLIEHEKTRQWKVFLKFISISVFIKIIINIATLMRRVLKM